MYVYINISGRMQNQIKHFFSYCETKTQVQRKPMP